MGQGCIHSAKASNCTNDGASASSPRKGSSRTRRPYALQLVNRQQVTLPTLSPTLSPRSHLPPIQQFSMSSSRNQPLSPGAASLHPPRPQFPAIPKPAILNTKRTPVPKFLKRLVRCHRRQINAAGPSVKKTWWKLRFWLVLSRDLLKKSPLTAAEKKTKHFIGNGFMSFWRDFITLLV